MKYIGMSALDPIKDSPAVKNWLSRLSEGTGVAYAYNFKDFMAYLHDDPKFGGLTPDELIAHQRSVEKANEYDVLDAVQRWVLSREGMRRGSKANLMKAVRSFFEHSRMSLPVDKSFRVRGDRPQVPTLLTLNEVKQVCLASTKMYRAAFLVMLGGGLDQASLAYWSDNGWRDLKPQLEREEKIIMVTIPGRKGSKFATTFSTYVYGDALAALKTWVNERGDGEGPIFTTQMGYPLSKNSLNDYWVRKLKDLGYITPIAKGGGRGKSNERYGRGIHNLRDLFRSQWSKSGASPQIAESMMGHVVDKYGYDQSFKDEKFAKAQVTKAAHWLNIMSSGTPFALVSEDRVTDLERQLEEAKMVQGGRVAELEAKVDKLTEGLKMLYEHPELIEKLKRGEI
jgi:integrase